MTRTPLILLDGKKVRDEKLALLQSAIAKAEVVPTLAIVQVGENQESDTYIAQKVKFGEMIGMRIDHRRLPGDTTQDALIGVIQDLNADVEIHGIIVQMPLPKHLNASELIEVILPEKDVDGLSSANIKKLWENDHSGFMPATTRGVIALLDHYQIGLQGKHVVVVGRSELVGKPTALACLNRNATVTICHSKTINLEEQTRRADILIVAVGKVKCIGASHVIEGQTVIDVGISAVSVPSGKSGRDGKDASRKVIGDVDFDAVKDIVGAISPVPGGVGPLTVASLLENVAQAAGVRVR